MNIFNNYRNTAYSVKVSLFMDRSGNAYYCPLRLAPCGVKIMYTMSYILNIHKLFFFINPKRKLVYCAEHETLNE